MRIRLVAPLNIAKYRGCRQRQKGQALILAVVCLLVLCLGLFVVFDTGQAVTKKEQLVNAADAAAYSVGIEQARALNTAAYLNRAEVANQVAIAQIVSLQSYGNYTDSMAGRLSKALELISIPLDFVGIGEVLTAAAETLQSMQEGLAAGLAVTDKVGTGVVTGLNALNMAYSSAQTVVFAAFAGETMFTTANGIVKKNTQDIKGDSAAAIPFVGQALLGAQLQQFSELGMHQPLAGGNWGYTTRFKIPQSRGSISGVPRNWAGDRDANVVMQARDGFSAGRNASPGFLGFHPIKKAGSTDMVDYNRWVAVDTLNFHFKLGWGWLSKTWDVPLAFGAAAAIPSRFEGSSSQSIISPGIRLTKGTGTDPSSYRPGHKWGWDSPYDSHHYDPYDGALGNISKVEVANDPTDKLFTNTVPQEVAWMVEEAPQSEEFHAGLQNYNDVDPGKAVQPYATSSSDDHDVGPVFTVYVQQSDDTIRTGGSSLVGMEGGDLKLKGHGVDGAMAAVSSAQVYYDRPMNLDFMRRADGKRELGNLFEPYWQVRLIETPPSYKLALGIATAL